MKIKSVWAVTANGSKAVIVKYFGSDSEEIIELDRDPEKIGEIKSDRAGRGFASVGKSRFGLELHSDPVRNRERLFAETISEFLSTHTRSEHVDQLIILASPRTLGDLRSAFPSQLLEKVRYEINKDLTALPKKELLARLQKITSRTNRI